MLDRFPAQCRQRRGGGTRGRGEARGRRTERRTRRRGGSRRRHCAGAGRRRDDGGRRHRHGRRARSSAIERVGQADRAPQDAKRVACSDAAVCIDVADAVRTRLESNGDAQSEEGVRSGRGRARADRHAAGADGGAQRPPADRGCAGREEGGRCGYPGYPNEQSGSRRRTRARRVARRTAPPVPAVHRRGCAPCALWAPDTHRSSILRMPRATQRRGAPPSRLRCQGGRVRAGCIPRAGCVPGAGGVVGAGGTAQGAFSADAAFPCAGPAQSRLPAWSALVKSDVRRRAANALELT